MEQAAIGFQGPVRIISSLTCPVAGYLKAFQANHAVVVESLANHSGSGILTSKNMFNKHEVCISQIIYCRLDWFRFD